MEIIELIKTKVKIDELFERNGHKTHMVNGGSKARCLCPFHQERTPSCWLDLDKNLFYCFGCKKGGDIFDFIKYQKNIDNFNETVNYFVKEYEIETINEENIVYETHIRKQINKYFKHEEEDSQNLSLLAINVYFLTKQMRDYCERHKYSSRKLPIIFNLYKIIDSLIQETFEDKSKLNKNLEKLELIKKYLIKESKQNA